MRGERWCCYSGQKKGGKSILFPEDMKECVRERKDEHKGDMAWGACGCCRQETLHDRGQCPSTGGLPGGC